MRYKGMQSNPQDEWTGVHIPRLWTRTRRRAIDKRTRLFKIWAARRAAFASELGRPASPSEHELLDALSDNALARDLLRARQAEGEHVDPFEWQRLNGELRRLRVSLFGKNGQPEPATNLDDMMGAA